MDSSSDLLAADIGNTNITLGAFRGETLLRVSRLDTRPELSARFYGRALRDFLRRAFGPRARAAVIAGSVVPALDPLFDSACRLFLGVRPLAVTPQSALGIRLRVETPREVGADRLLNALAARRLFGGPAVVLDFGTATTFDCVSGRGDYLGGAILPGPRLAARALALHTAKLPLVEVRRPRRVIGKNTVECIQAGLYYGYLGMVEGVLARTLAEMRSRRRVKVLATGGLASLFARDLNRLDAVEPDLTLHGLRLAFGILNGQQGIYHKVTKTRRKDV